MKRAMVGLAVILIAGCAYPWDRYYASCVRSGTPDQVCYQQAEEMRLQNARTLMDYQRSLQAPKELTCITTDAGGGMVRTQCY